MSSKMQIVKICEFCKNEFIAKTTVAQCCSDGCAKRYYKLKKRNEAISQTKIISEIKLNPYAYITPEKMAVVQAKEFLDLKEAALLLNVSPLTLRRWVLSGKMKSQKIGMKHYSTGQI